MLVRLASDVFKKRRKTLCRQGWSLSSLVAAALGLMTATLGPSPTYAQANISVGSGPVLAVAAIQLAVAKDYFKEEGLNVTLTPLSSGAATLAALIGGSLQFAPTNVTSVAVARSKGIKIKIVAQESAGSDNVKTAFDGLLVRGDSAIKRPSDLAGKTVAVNAINSIGTLTTSRAVEKDGGDYKAVKWIELPQGDALTALASGSVDAVWIIEPFVTIGEQRGFRQVFSPYTETDPDFAESVVVAAESYLDANPDVSKRFKRALDKALALGAKNPEEIRQMVPSYMKVPPELLPKVRLPRFPTQMNVASIKAQIDLAAKYGYIDSPISIDDLVWRAP